MVERNAKNLLLLGRQGARSAAAIALLEELTSRGVNVWAPACDVANRDVVTEVLLECVRRMPPIKGCIVGTMVLKVMPLLWKFLAEHISLTASLGLHF